MAGLSELHSVGLRDKDHCSEAEFFPVASCLKAPLQLVTSEMRPG